MRYLSFEQLRGNHLANYYEKLLEKLSRHQCGTVSKLVASSIELWILLPHIVILLRTISDIKIVSTRLVIIRSYPASWMLDWIL